MKTLSSTATTRPTAFSALTAAARPELRWSGRRTRTPSSRRRSNRPLQSPCWIPVPTPAIRQLDPAPAKPPLRARYARGCDSHSISTPEARGTAVEAVPYRLAAIGSGLASQSCGAHVRIARTAEAVQVAGAQRALSVTEATSLAVSLSPAASRLCSRCDTDPVPGIGRIDGDRASSHASTICRGVAS